MANSIPRAEHPNPQFERESWLNLNGEWEFEIDNSVSGRERGLQNAEHLSSKIIVPFCPESRLSGVENTDFMNCVTSKSAKASLRAESYCTSARSTMTQQST